MRKILALILVVSVVVFAGIFSAQAQNSSATAEVQNSEGDTVGNATFTTTDEGNVEVDVELSDFTSASQGEHAFHIHQTGQCTPTFKASGGHFNPTDTQHGFLNADGPHVGDLPMIRIDEDGNANYNWTTERITLGEGETSVVDEDGSALIVHAGTDDYITDPAGKGGDRIACGVITKSSN